MFIAKGPRSPNIILGSEIILQHALRDILLTSCRCYSFQTLCYG